MTYDVEVGFHTTGPRAFTAVKPPHLGDHGALFIQLPDRLVVYASGRWSGYTVKENNADT